MINYRTFNPKGVVADYVRFFWRLDVNVAGGSPFIHRALPDNFIELIFYCKGTLSITSNSGDEGNTFRSGVFGQARVFRQFRACEDFSLFGVYLNPYSFKTLFGLPACDLTNEKVDIKSLWGNAGSILEEKVMMAESDELRVQLISDFFMERIQAKGQPDATLVRELKSSANSNIIRSINTFAHDCHLSRRQFERKFKELAGFTPKDFFTIVRFKKALQEMKINNQSLAQIAVNAGYYDQSHFTNEFKELSGYTPKEFSRNHDAAPDLRATRDFKE